MKYSKAQIESFGYELAPVVVTSDEIEEMLAPVYKKLHLQPGMLETWTGIEERRWWDNNPSLSAGSIQACKDALSKSNVAVDDLSVLIYAGVNREHFEPATACAVANGLGVSLDTTVFDITNACLGVLNGMLEIANRIELGQIRAGIVTSCETAREINEITIKRLMDNPVMDHFTQSIATFTGGSGAVAVLLTDGSFGTEGKKLKGGVSFAAPEFHELCRWGVESTDQSGINREFFMTDSTGVLKNGVELGKKTWDGFLAEMGWTADQVDKTVCHQVGSAHQETILKTINRTVDDDFVTYPFLGNTGTVALPISTAIAEERDFIEEGERVAMLGIGSGLNCMMLGMEC